MPTQLITKPSGSIGYSSAQIDQRTTVATANVILAAVDPTVNDDSGDGIVVGMRWHNETSDKVFEVMDVTVGAAVWVELTGGGGAGTVTSVGVSSTDLSVSGSPVTTAGVITLDVNNDAITNPKLANMATQTFKGRNTAGTGDPEDLSIATSKTMLNLAGTNTGDQTITLTSDVTGSGTGSFATTIANNAVTNAKLNDVATQTFKGRNTGGTGDPEDLTVATAKTMLNLAGTNTGDQTITLTGDVTGSGTASFAATIAAAAVTLAKMANLAANSFIGNNTGAPATPVALTQAQATALLNVFTSVLQGLVPPSGGGTSNFLRADGTWAPAGGGTGTILGTIANTQVAFGTALDTIGGEAAFNYDSATNTLNLNGNLTQTAIATPSAPASTDGRHYVFDLANRLEPSFLSPNEPRYDLQPGLKAVTVLWAIPGSGTAIDNIGMPDSNTGTVSTPTQATTNVRTRTHRWNIVSAAVAGSSAGTRANKVMCWRGNAAGLGGFTFFARFAFSTADAQQRTAIGMRAATAVIGNVNPSTLVDCLFVGNDTGDTNLQIMHNDASGSCTKIDLGANFPAVTSSTMYTVTFYSAPNGSTVGYRVVNLETGNVATGTLSTDLPTNTTMLAPQTWINNNASASAVGIDGSIIYLELPY